MSLSKAKLEWILLKKSQSCGTEVKLSPEELKDCGLDPDYLNNKANGAIEELFQCRLQFTEDGKRLFLSLITYAELSREGALIHLNPQGLQRMRVLQLHNEEQQGEDRVLELLLQVERLRKQRSMSARTLYQLLEEQGINSNPVKLDIEALKHYLAPGASSAVAKDNNLFITRIIEPALKELASGGLKIALQKIKVGLRIVALLFLA